MQYILNILKIATKQTNLVLLVLSWLHNSYILQCSGTFWLYWHLRLYQSYLWNLRNKKVNNNKIFIKFNNKYTPPKKWCKSKWLADLFGFQCNLFPSQWGGPNIFAKAYCKPLKINFFQLFFINLFFFCVCFLPRNDLKTSNQWPKHFGHFFIIIKKYQTKIRKQIVVFLLYIYIQFAN